MRAYISIFTLRFVRALMMIQNLLMSKNEEMILKELSVFINGLSGNHKKSLKEKSEQQRILGSWALHHREVAVLMYWS